MSRPTRKTPQPSRVPLPEKHALSVADASCYSSVPERRIREAISRREVAVVRYGGGVERDRFVILRADLEIWLRKLRRPAADEIDK